MTICLNVRVQQACNNILSPDASIRLDDIRKVAHGASVFSFAHQHALKPVFTCDLDRYGRIGHQTSRMITAFLLAHFWQGRYIPQEYKFFSYRANDAFCFRNSHLAFRAGHIHKIAQLSDGFRPPHGNDCYPTDSPSGLRRMMGDIASLLNDNNGSEDCILITLPFDQPPGYLTRLLERSDVSADFARISGPVRQLGERSSSDKRLRVCVHIRRGDVSSERHPGWWISDEFYVEALRRLDRELSDDVMIDVYSQEPLAPEIKILCTGRIRLHLDPGQWSNDQEIQALAGMCSASVLIGTISSFSCLASLVTHGKYILLEAVDAHGLPFGVTPAYTCKTKGEPVGEMAKRLVDAVKNILYR